MGSKSKSSNTSGQTQSTMSGLSRGRVSNDAVAGMQQDLQNSQMSDVAGGFGAMLQDAKSMFGQNPMMNLMGGMLGMPMQIETPDAMRDFINKYRQPEQSPQTQQQGMPQQQQLQTGGGLGMDPRAPRDMTAHEPGNPTAMPQGVMGNMTPEQMAAIQSMHGYGRR